MPKIKEFIPNEIDNLHCLQSCYAMINNTIFNEQISSKEAEPFTNFKKGTPTWPFKFMFSFALKGLSVINIEKFPINLFVENPHEAIRTQMKDEEISNQIIAISNFDVEVDIVKKCLSSGKVKFEERIPTLEDIVDLISKGYFIMCNVNYWMLIGNTDKYDGHFVVVEDIKDGFVTLQNPGLPPVTNQKITTDNFIKAWCFPDQDASNIIAISQQ